MGAGNHRKRQLRRLRRAQASQGNFEDKSAMDSDHADQEDDDRRRNTSSEDEGEEGSEDNQGQLITTGPPIDPKLADLVNHASQMIGHSGADGTTMALAAASTTNPAEALNLLAASSAVAKMGVQSARSLAAHGVTEAGLATEGVRNSDFTYDNRFKRYDKELRRHDEELQRLKERDIELQNRVAFLEGLLSRVLSMMQSGNIDAAEVAQMLRNLGI